MKWSARLGEKQQFLISFLSKMNFVVNFILKQQGFPILHTDAQDRLDDTSTHHKPHFPQDPKCFKPSHNMVRSAEERFALERMATRGFGSKKIAAALGVQEATTKQRLRSHGDMASRNIGRPRNETPLRFTASQTDTTRGVVVSGIICACDIAPSLHFVEPGLKLNAEERIKVMDEYNVPNCTALMEPGRISLLILDNAPSHASRLACEH